MAAENLAGCGFANFAQDAGILCDAVRWMPTEYMWADGLTKRDKHLRRRFLEWLGNVKVRLKE